MTEGFYRIALDCVDAAVIATDETGHVLSLNARAVALLGGRKPAIGAPIDQVLMLIDPRQHQPLAPHPVMQVLSGRGRTTGTALVRTSQGLASINLAVHPVTAHHGVVSGAIVMLQPAGASAGQASEKGIDHGAASMSKAEAVSRMAGSVAHDFNSVLTLMLGNLELLFESERLQPDQLELLAEIREACSLGAGLAQQLLAYSRSQPMVLRPMNLNEIIDHHWPLLARVLGQRIDLVRITDETLPLVRVDGPQVERVLLNLLTNARDALVDGGTVSIATERRLITADCPDKRAEMEDGEYALLTVSDTGSGVDDVTLARMFEPFFTTKTMGRGTGLGLATVYGIVKQFGGYIYVTTGDATGTTFTIYLPAIARKKLSR